MKEARSCPQERGHVRSVWLKRAAIALVLGIILTGCAPSGPPGGMEPTLRQPTVMPATPTKVPTPSQEVPRPTPTQGAQAPTPAVSPTPFAVPEELPSKGSPDAKVTLVVFCDFI